MQLVIANGKVAATHDDDQDLTGKYPDTCEIVSVDGDDFSLIQSIKEDGTQIVPAQDPRPTMELEEFLNGVRRHRDQLLEKSDWSQTVDAPLSQESKQGWAVYRQALRDLPSTLTDPEAPVNWPEKP